MPTSQVKENCSNTPTEPSCFMMTRVGSGQVRLEMSGSSRILRLEETSTSYSNSPKNHPLQELKAIHRYCTVPLLMQPIFSNMNTNIIFGAFSIIARKFIVFFRVSWSATSGSNSTKRWGIRLPITRSIAN